MRLDRVGRKRVRVDQVFAQPPRWLEGDGDVSFFGLFG